MRFTRDIPDLLKRSGPVEDLKVSVGDNITWVSGTSGSTQMNSELAFVLVVDAQSEVDAQRVARDEVLPPVLATLATIIDAPVEAQVVMAHVTAPAGSKISAVGYGPIARSFSWFAPPPGRISDEKLPEFAGLLREAHADATARIAAYEIQTANRHVWSMGNEVVGAQAVMLAYYFAMERVSDVVTKSSLPESDAEQVRLLVEELGRALAQESASLDEQVEAIEHAAAGLRELRSLSMKRRVALAGSIMRLPPELVDEAGRFTDFRHKRLAHATAFGQATSKSVLDQVHPARKLAVSYLSGYLRWLVDRRTATTP